MKKLLALMIAGVLVLSACSESDEKEVEKKAEETVEKGKEVAKDTKDKVEEKVEETKKDPNTIETESSKIIIKKSEKIDNALEKGKKILALHIEFTNKGKEPVSPWMDQSFKAEQETDSTVEVLTGANGLFPEDYEPKLVKMGDTDIKPGKTVEAVIGFDLIDPDKPVYIRPFVGDDFEIVLNK